MKTFTKSQLASRVATMHKAWDCFHAHDERMSVGLEYGWKAEEKSERLFAAFQAKQDKLIADCHEAGLCGEDGFSDEDMDNFPERLQGVFIDMLGDGTW